MGRGQLMTDGHVPTRLAGAAAAGLFERPGWGVYNNSGGRHEPKSIFARGRCAEGNVDLTIEVSDRACLWGEALPY